MNELSSNVLRGHLRLFMMFDESDYLQAHPDVAEAVKNGSFKSGYQHFKAHGIAENRFPGFGTFDADQYIEDHPSVGAGLSSTTARHKIAKLYYVEECRTRYLFGGAPSED